MDSLPYWDWEPKDLKFSVVNIRIFGAQNGSAYFVQYPSRSQSVDKHQPGMFFENEKATRFDLLWFNPRQPPPQKAPFPVDGYLGKSVRAGPTLTGSKPTIELAAPGLNSERPARELGFPPNDLDQDWILFIGR